MGKRRPRPTPVLPEPLPGLVDAHTHLYSCGHRTGDEVRAAADRAALAGVAALVTVGDDLAESEAAVAAAEADERVYAAVAVHPTRAREVTDPETGPAARAGSPSWPRTRAWWRWGRPAWTTTGWV